MIVTSTILKTSMRLLMPLALLFAIYTAIKGHDEPGGGFIGGLIAATAICLYRMAYGPEAVYRLLPIHPRWLIVTGLSLALITAIMPLLFGHPFLRSVVLPEMHLASAMGFDTGVMLVVVGVAAGMIIRLNEELED
jgi:multicomponent Na+:H+ antiporter subunit B